MQLLDQEVFESNLSGEEKEAAKTLLGNINKRELTEEELEAALAPIKERESI